MAKYLALQNKALRQGLYLAYASVTAEGKTTDYTTNGHIMVLGKLEEVKPLKAQYDLRPEPYSIRMDFKNKKEVELEPSDDTVMAGDHEYQSIYVQYISARYPVAEWMQAGDKLLAVDASNNIIGAVAPLKPEEVKENELEYRQEKYINERGNT